MIYRGFLFPFMYERSLNKISFKAMYSFVVFCGYCLAKVRQFFFHQLQHALLELLKN